MPYYCNLGDTRNPDDASICKVCGSDGKRCSKMRIIIALISLSLAFSGCASLTKGKGEAESAVSRFHQQLNSEQYDEIYNQSSEKFRGAVKEADSKALFEAVHRKLGNVKNATLSNWQVNATTEGTFVSLVYNVEFTEGNGAEQFVFLVNGERASLVNYNINSPLLITK
jgi:hypothetical protein